MVRPTRLMPAYPILSSGLGYTPSGGTTTAGDVTVIDAGDYYAGDTVEEILQEIGLILSGHVEVVTSSGSSVVLDYETARYWDITLTDDCTFTFSNPPDDQTWGQLVVILRQGSGAPYTVTWPAEAQWQDTDGTGGGTPPTLWTVVDAVDVVTFVTVDGGTTWGGNHEHPGGSALTVEDEGTPLATPATTLDFVGAGVTASGTGATKTITISGAPTGAAGGDLSGTYPNPSVVDDSHSHTGATLPATSPSDHQHVFDVLMSGDGSTTAFELPAAPFDEYSVQAFVSGVLTEVTLSGTMFTTATFGAAPASASNNIRFDIVAAAV